MGSVDKTEPKARTDCVESSQSKECSVAVKSQPKSGASVATRVHHGSHQQKLRQGQQNLKTTPLRRKVTPVKAKPPTKAAASTSKPPSQVVNRARGTLHGLSTIKRHGNVRVT